MPITPWEIADCWTEEEILIYQKELEEKIKIFNKAIQIKIERLKNSMLKTI